MAKTASSNGGANLGFEATLFLGEFAAAEGRKGGQFWTPQCVVQLLVAMLAPLKGRVFDRCSSTDGIFVRREKLVEAHGGRLGDIAVYGLHSNCRRPTRGPFERAWPRKRSGFIHHLAPTSLAGFVLANGKHTG